MTSQRTTTVTLGLVRSRARLVRLATTALIVTFAVSAAGGCSSDGSDGLVGEWELVDAPSVVLPADFDPSSATITFDGDEGWTASDGCNDLTGDYTLDRDGNFTSEAGAVAGVGCSGGQIPYDLLLSQTDHVTFQSDETAVFETSDNEPILTLSPAS